MAAKKASKKPKAEKPQIFTDIVCALCPCCCDDLVISVQAGRIVNVEGGCDAGRAAILAFTEKDVGACFVDGKQVTLEQGIGQAAMMLRAAKRPMITGLEHATCEAQRACASIADRTGGVIDAGDAAAHAALLALQQMGQSTCTWGEAIHRADLIVFWGVGPALTHAGLFQRLRNAGPNELLPNGGASRQYVYVDVSGTRAESGSSEHLSIPPNGQFETLWTLRALNKGIESDAEQVLSCTGVQLAVWQELLQRLKHAKYAVILFGEGLTAGASARQNCEAMFALVRELNAHTRVCCNALPAIGGNAVGAGNVLAWRTGYPMSVDFSRGYPRYAPGECDAEVTLSRNEADVRITLYSDSIAVESHAMANKSIGRSVRFQTATFGISTEGTIHRADEVALPLRPILKSNYPTHEELLLKIGRLLPDQPLNQVRERP